jgi:ribosomal protein S18 acetylase RimI-like enzyme
MSASRSPLPKLPLRLPLRLKLPLKPWLLARARPEAHATERANELRFEGVQSAEDEGRAIVAAAPQNARPLWQRLRVGATTSVPAGEAAENRAPMAVASAVAAPTAPRVDVGAVKMPRPAIRWVGPRARVALRSFDYSWDIEAVAAFQRDNYELNFPDFAYSRDFENAFRLDVRRAALDPNHAIYVLDEISGASASPAPRSRIVGFVWLVVCENGWTHERYGYVNNLYLLPERRGQGLASEMMAQADAFFRSRRIRRVRLTVTASNADAVALYERSGFSTTRWEMEKDIV